MGTRGPNKKPEQWGLTRGGCMNAFVVVIGLVNAGSAYSPGETNEHTLSPRQICCEGVPERCQTRYAAVIAMMSTPS